MKDQWIALRCGYRSHGEVQVGGDSLCEGFIRIRCTERGSPEVRAARVKGQRLYHVWNTRGELVRNETEGGEAQEAA